ncbi:Transcription factor bHLH25 isoform B [Glycine soja]|nr:Transcription factor bHLH25 isoform B [Glycine soja]
MDCGNDFSGKCHGTHDDEFLRDILLQQPPAAFSSESESDHSFRPVVQNTTITNDGAVKSNSSQNSSKRPRPLSTPRTYILSFDNSTMLPASPEPRLRSSNNNSPWPPESPGPEPRRPITGGAKKTRTSSQTIDHIMAERRRRQDLTERFIALSATIPGLSKTDKASVLRAAIDYLKQLQERVQELEKQDKKRSKESVIFNKKPDPNGNNNEDTTTSTETNCSILPEMEVRVLGKEVLIEIHCEKENGVELKILDHLENLHLSVTGSSVLPFGNSSLCITITAQMGEGYQMTMNDLVKNLRQVLSKSHLLSDSDPY